MSSSNFTIYTVGCSFTNSSVIENNNNWVRFFSNKLTSYLPNKFIIENHAQGGTSIKWTLNAIRQIKQQDPNAFIISQITKSGRHNWWIEQSTIYDYYEMETYPLFNPYYKEYYRDNKKIYGFNAGTLYDKNNNDLTREIKEFGFQYYNYNNLDFEYSVYVDSVIRESNFSYFQLQGSADVWKKYTFSTSKIDVLESEYGIEHYKSQEIDVGRHLSDTGNMYVANWIMGKTQHLICDHFCIS